MIEPVVRKDKWGFWDVLFFGLAYPFQTEDAARRIANVEDITSGKYIGIPINWDDYEGLERIG